MPGANREQAKATFLSGSGRGRKRRPALAYLQIPLLSGELPGLQRMDCRSARAGLLEGLALPDASPLLASAVADISTEPLVELGLAMSIA